MKALRDHANYLAVFGAAVTAIGGILLSQAPGGKLKSGWGYAGLTVLAVGVVIMVVSVGFYLSSVRRERRDKRMAEEKRSADEVAAKEEEAALDERRKWATEKYNALAALIAEGKEMAANLPDTYNHTVDIEVMDWLERIKVALQDANLSSEGIGAKPRFVVRNASKEMVDSTLLTLGFTVYHFAVAEGIQ